MTYGQISYEGKQRWVLGALHYPDAPEPGTIVGPNDAGETLVLFGPDPADATRTLVGLATVPDMERARVRAAALGPGSVHERQRMR